jgi:hypothetical protein
MTTTPGRLERGSRIRELLAEGDVEEVPEHPKDLWEP